jgi:hypothetical protein
MFLDVRACFPRRSSSPAIGATCCPRSADWWCMRHSCLDCVRLVSERQPIRFFVTHAAAPSMLAAIVDTGDWSHFARGDATVFFTRKSQAKMQVVRELTDLTRLQQILEPHGGSRECSVNQLLNAVEYNNANDRDNDRSNAGQKECLDNVSPLFESYILLCSSTGRPRTSRSRQPSICSSSGEASCTNAT